MRVSALLPLATLALSAASLGTSDAANFTICTDEERDLYASIADDAHWRCGYFLFSFEVCDDTCRGVLQGVAEKAPNCLTSEYTNTTRKMDQVAAVKRCDAALASKAYKYVPIRTPELANCSETAEKEWKKKYQANSTTPYSKCVKPLNNNEKTCSDSCLKTIEEATVDPLMTCRYTGDYSLREIEKKYLAACLNARGDDLEKNAVLQGKSSSSSSKSSSSSSKPSSSSDSPATSAAMSGMLSAALVVGSVVVTALALI